MQKTITFYLCALLAVMIGHVAAYSHDTVYPPRAHSAFSKRSSSKKSSSCSSGNDETSGVQTTTTVKTGSNSTSTGKHTTAKVIANVKSSCGNPDPTAKPTGTDGPNGKLDWLNCGVDGDGWNPPSITLDSMIYADLDVVMKDSNNVFSACKPYVSLFKSIGDKYEIPPIILASIAMQESSCQPNTANGGLMQLTKDKCPGGKEGSACNVPSYNIDAGAKYFKETLDSNEGSVPVTLGIYNGWVPGLTIHTATKIKSQCCECQNNLDYIHQTMNGWFQAVSPYSTHMGKYFNVEC